MYNVLLRKMTSARIASRRRALCLPGNTREAQAIDKMLVRTMGIARDGVKDILETISKGSAEAGGGSAMQHQMKLWNAVGDGVLGKWEMLVGLGVMRQEEGGEQYSILLTTCVLLNRL
jgi:hypothetical protein